MRARQQRGATAVEFALVLTLFLMFLLGVVDFSRMLFTWAAANEATRAGARYAVVCEDPAGGTTRVLARVQALLPQVTAVTVAWEPSSCTTATCEGVRVRVSGLQFRWISPLVGLSNFNIALPGFETYLPREAMRTDPHSGTIC